MPSYIPEIGLWSASERILGVEGDRPLRAVATINALERALVDSHHTVHPTVVTYQGCQICGGTGRVMSASGLSRRMCRTCDGTGICMTCQLLAAV